MDPCPFVRVLVGNLALKIPVASKPARSGVHPSSSPCYCRIRLGDPACLFHNGWVSVGKEGGKSVPSAQLHLTVRAEPDPRFVFEFGGDPEISPQVFQVQGTMRQPVFTCRFSCRNSDDRYQRSRCATRPRKTCNSISLQYDMTIYPLGGPSLSTTSPALPLPSPPWSPLRRLSGLRQSEPLQPWCVAGSPPGDGTWKPWGRLEAWRERGGSSDGLGLQFELLPDPSIGSVGVLLAESTLSTSKGGKFNIDLAGNNGAGRSVSPAGSPRGSGDYGYLLSPLNTCRGFVMSSTVEGERSKSSRPTVEVGVQQVGCTEDAAAFVALAAAIDLSMDACRLFSCRLKKELCQQQDSSS
ncbi:unnamed protein product [Spirodela intermedia]|uniref:Uncharacterized protein n=1 Tax=Spirodela intermedia TaxID=51605 RepID=A0A7I8IIG9_SPIIN|nr:unnamed protein product [Spirodela intermedia]CAA6657642.1 unnamed protein product [Spirodela intermedia]